jgi:AraC-like DNA-binding protein
MQLSTKQKWSTIIAEQKASQLTVAAFCRQAHISPSTFYQRKRELDGDNMATTFVKATVTKSVEIAQHNEPITLTIGNVTMSFPQTIKADYLATLIRGFHA